MKTWLTHLVIVALRRCDVQPITRARTQYADACCLHQLTQLSSEVAFAHHVRRVEITLGPTITNKKLRVVRASFSVELCNSAKLVLSCRCPRRTVASVALSLASHITGHRPRGRHQARSRPRLARRNQSRNAGDKHSAATASRGTNAHRVASW